MSKVIFLGTDLHGDPTELAAKTVRNLQEVMSKNVIVSIEHRKKRIKKEGLVIIPKIFSNSRLRRISQAIMLPLSFLWLRREGYTLVFSFWVANKRYHKHLFRFMKFLGYKINFTVISGNKTNADVLNECNLVICQSESMKNQIKDKVDSKIEIIYPGVNLKIFRPGKKKEGLLIPSVPYSVTDFHERGIETVLKIIKDERIPSAMIFRSGESYEFVKKKKIKNIKLIRKNLKDLELAEIMGKAKTIPLYYSESPDMPLSAIEGLASGCPIICTKKMGFAEIVKKEDCGNVVKNEEELLKAIKKVMKSKSYQIKARKTAEKYFDIGLMKESYKNLI